MTPDPRVEQGMRALLALRRRRLESGERPVGWKVAFGSPDAMQRLGIERPLVGFLTDAGLVDDGSAVPIRDWAAPVLEAEIAVRVGRDVPGGASRAEVRDAVSGVAPAIELADVQPPPSDPAEILAGNIFHRRVLLGPWDERRRDGEGVTARVLLDAKEIAATEDPAAATGEVLAQLGETLRGGEFVITGAVVPPIPVAAGQRVTAELPPLGSVSVSLV
jgi:2-keto-4-pentenoate hydratase